MTTGSYKMTFDTARFGRGQVVGRITDQHGFVGGALHLLQSIGSEQWVGLAVGTVRLAGAEDDVEVCVEPKVRED